VIHDHGTDRRAHVEQKKSDVAVLVPAVAVARSAKAARHTTKKPANTGAPDTIRTCDLHLRRGLDHKTNLY